MDNLRRIVVAITGASGSIFGIRTMEALSGAGIETHLVVSKWGLQTIQHETGLSIKDVKSLADIYYDSNNLGAAISSGSFRVDGMIIVPCSMRTLAAVANGLGDNLIHRAADVILKESLPLVIVPRESPLNQIHLQNMIRLSKMGVTIIPPIPAFYNHPKNLDDMINHIVTRILDQLNVVIKTTRRWTGDMKVQNKKSTYKIQTIKPVKDIND